MKQILAIYPNGEKDTIAGLVSDGLKNTENVQVFKYDYSIKNYTEEEIISISKKVNYIFVFWCKYQYNYVHSRFTLDLLDKINKPEIVAYIDGSEYNATGKPTHLQKSDNLKRDPSLCKGEPWIDEEMYKRCKWYFKRETYKEDLIRKKIIPLLVSSKNSYFQNEDNNLLTKTYDMFCSFSHVSTGLRLETQDICQKLLNEGYNNVIGGNFPYVQYMDYIINSYIGVSAWGAGNSCRRMWEIMSNKTCCFVQKKQIEFPNIFEDGISYVEYSTPKEFEEKAKYYLDNKEKCIEIGQKGYEHIKKYHTSIKRIEYMFKIMEGNKFETALK